MKVRLTYAFEFSVEVDDNDGLDEQCIGDAIDIAQRTVPFVGLFPKSARVYMGEPTGRTGRTEPTGRTGQTLSSWLALSGRTGPAGVAEAGTHNRRGDLDGTVSDAVYDIGNDGTNWWIED